MDRNEDIKMCNINNITEKTTCSEETKDRY